MSCQVDFNTVRKGIVNAVTKMATEKDAFDIGEEGRLVPIGSDYQEVIDDINNQFGSQIITEDEDYDNQFIITPTQHLIQKYLSYYENPTEIVQTEQTPQQILYNLKVENEIESLQNFVLAKMTNDTADAANRNITSYQEGQYYIGVTPKDSIRLTPEEREKLIKKNVQRFYQKLDFYKVPRNLFELEDFATKSNRHGVRVNKANIKSVDKLQKTDKANRVNAIIDFLSEKFNLSSNIEYITKEEFKKRYPSKYVPNMTSAVVKDTIFLFGNELTNDIVAEELLHPFINIVNARNPALFANLLAEAKKSFPILSANTQELYNSIGQDQSVIDKEIVTKVLALHFNKESEANPPTLKFREVVEQFLTWMIDAFKALFEYFGYRDMVETSELPSDLTFDDLAKLINTTDVVFQKAFDEETYYDLASQTAEGEKVRELHNIYKVVYESIKDNKDIEDLFAKVPEAVKELRNRLKSTKNTQEAEMLTNLIKNSYELTEKEAQVKSDLATIITVVDILNALEKKVNHIQKTVTDPNQKIIQLNDIRKVLDGLAPFTDIVTKLYNQLTRDIDKIPKLANFYRLLHAANSLSAAVSDNITSLLKNPIIDILVEYNAPIFKAKIKELEDEIKNKEIERDAAMVVRDTNRVTQLNKLISQRKADRDKLPTRETFEKMFGETGLKDANFISKNLESFINNGHVLVSSVMSMIQDAYDRANINFLNSRNVMQVAIDELRKSVSVNKRSSDKFYNRIRTVVTRVTKTYEKEIKDADGNVTGSEVDFETVEQYAFLNEVDPNYITEHEKHRGKLDYALDMLRKARKEKDDRAIAKYGDMLKQFSKDMRAFVKENAEGKYDEKVYQMWEKLDEELGRNEKDQPISLRSAKGEVYDLLEHVENLLEMHPSAEIRDQLLDERQGYLVDIKQIKNRKNEETGELKTGIQLALAEAAIAYDELKYTYGSYETTPEGIERFNYDMTRLTDDLASGVITQKEYDFKKSQRTKTIISQDYFKAKQETAIQVDELLQEILAIPELAANYSKEDKEKISQAWENIKEEARPYRDQDGVIDGQFLSTDNPDLVKRIKTQQEAVELVKRQSIKLTQLSMEEKLELRDLTNNKTKTVEEQERMRQLTALSEKKLALYKLHKPLIDKYNEYLKFLTSLSYHEPSHYYIAESEFQINSLRASAEVKEIVAAQLAGDSIVISGEGQFDKDEGKWYKKIGNSYGNTPINVDILAQHLERQEAEARLKSSKWWQENHLKTIYYDKKVKDYVETEKPIYIWVSETPKNENWIQTDQPASSYQTYKIKPEYVNQNYKTIGFGIAAPKAGKHESQEFKKLAASTDPEDQAYFKYLTFARAFYKNSQNILDESMKMGDILPSMIKTKTENTVNMTDEAFSNPKKFAKDLWDRTLQFSGQETHEDESFLLGGSIKNTKKIPIRFISKINKDRQSGDISAMLLAFDLSIGRYNELNKQLPIIESIQRAAKNLKVTETKNVRTSVINAAKKTFGNVQVEKPATTTSVVSQSIDAMVDMFVYGQTSKEQILNIWGKRFDINKVVSSFLGFTSKAIFIGGLLPGIKNSIATRLELVKQINMKQGIYGISNIAHAHAQLPKFMKDAMKDYTKAGNKTRTGQILDYFGVVPENVMMQVNEKINYNLGEDKLTLLMAPKSFSEFEAIVTQFLAIADAHLVEVNGKMVPLLQAFELRDDNGNVVEEGGKLQPKAGASFSNADFRAFTNKFRKASREIAGAYRHTEQTEFETYWWGKAAMYMSKYLGPGLVKRFGGRRYSIEYGDITDGVYKSGVKSIFSLFKDYNFSVKNWNSDRSAEEKAALLMMGREISIVIAMMGLITLIGGGGDPEDRAALKDNSWLHNFMIATAIASKTETETFIPIVGFGLDDMLRKAKNPFLAMQQVTNFAKAAQQLWWTATGDDDAYYKQNTGLHDKGDSKLVATLLKIIGYTGKTFDPVELIKTQQQIAKLR